MKRFIQAILVLCFCGPAFAFQQLQKESPQIDRSNILCGHQEILSISSKLKLQEQLSLDEFKKSSKVEHEVGDIISFFAVDFTSQENYSLDAELRHKTDKTYIFVEKPQWDNGRVTQNDVDAFHNAFEVSTPTSSSISRQLPGASIDPNKGIRDIDEQYFGDPPNRTGDGYVYILILDIKDSYDPDAGNHSFVAGYFSPQDQTGAANSNKKDIIYVDADPLNPAGEFALLAVAHEYQHLIHYRYDTSEENWLSEGLAEYAQQLCGYGIAAPFGFFANPNTPLTSWGGEIADYERVGLWTVYLGEKFGSSLITSISQDPEDGVTSVRNALDQAGVSLSFEEIFTNFTLANVANEPTIGSNGYYGYEAFRLPFLPVVTTTHPIYPVDAPIRSLQSYSAIYFRFTGIDETAILHFNGDPTKEISANIVERGTQSSVYPIQLNSSNQGETSLANIGNGVLDMILVATSLNNVTPYSYSVTSEIIDLAPPRITLGPRESLSTGTSITIYWETDELSTSLMQFGLTDEYGTNFEENTPKVVHQVGISNLQPNTTYHYRVGAKDQRGNGPIFSADFYFITPSTTTTAIATVSQTHSFGNEGRNIVVSSNGDIHIVYHEIVGQRRFVYHKKSSDNGETFSPATEVDNSLYFGGMPSIAIDSADRLHIGWHAQETSTSTFKVYYSRSDDGGAIWSTPKLVSKIYTADDNLYAAIALDPSENPHIVWNSVLPENEVNLGDTYHNFSSDGGETWPDDKMISNSESHLVFVPTIDFNSSGHAYVFYVDGDFNQQTRNAYHVTSVDYQQWTPQEAVSSSGVLYDGMTSFTIDAQNNVHAVFSDNFTPGDIRVMYTKFIASGESTGWTTPIPIAQSIVPGGFTSYTNISVDENMDLYVLYRDSQEASSSSFSKALQKNYDYESKQALSKVAQGVGDAYLAIFRDGSWQPAANISNDSPNTDFAELPSRVSNGVLDIMWMREFSETNNQITFLHLDTKQQSITDAPKVTSVFPEDGAADVPYFRQILNISAVYDQRILADSLNDSNVTVSSPAGPISGELSYDESQKTMIFTPTDNLPPDQEITITIKTGVVGTSGLPLDGNGNGQADGSPDDYFTWSFSTQVLDVVPPTLTIGVLQNPILTRYVDLYVVASENLFGPPNLTLNDAPVMLSLLNESAHIYKGDTKLTGDGVLNLEVTAKDFADNADTTSKSFSAQLFIAEKGGGISSHDGLLSLRISAGSLSEDTYLTVVALDESVDPSSGKAIAKSSLGLPVYRIGPSSLTLNKKAHLEFGIEAPPGKILILEQMSESGTWEVIPSDFINDRLSAKISSLGTFRVNKADQIIPTRFALQQNYPNPFTSKTASTIVAFDLPVQETIEINIFNLLGKKVRTLFAGLKKAGTYKIRWDGLNDNNIPVASGVYIYQLKAASTILNKKMLILQ